MDADGKPFSVDARTLDISRTGARLRDVRCNLRSGDIIAMQSPTGRGRFRISGFGATGTERQDEISLCCVEPGKCIWDPKYFGLPSGRKDARRKAERFLCTGTAEVLPARGGMPMWCKLTDVSYAGCYLECPSPLPPDTLVQVMLSIGEVVIRAEAEVRTSHTTVGMGLAFRHLSDEDAEQFSRIVNKLAGIYDERDAATSGLSPQWEAHMRACEDALESMLGLIEEKMVQPDLALVGDLERLLRAVTDLWESTQTKLSLEK